MPKATKDYGTIGGRIAQLRIDAGLSQKELADDLMVERVLVNYWENNKRPIKTDDIVKLADKFNVTCDYLLRGIEAENVSINGKTGLSDEAISVLSNLSGEKLAEGTESFIGATEIVNELITDKHFRRFLQLTVFACVTKKRCELTPVEPEDYDKLRYLEITADEDDALFAQWKMEHHLTELASSVFDSFYIKKEPILQKIIYEREDQYLDLFYDTATAQEKNKMLLKAGITPEKIVNMVKEAGCDPDEITPKLLEKVGFTPEQVAFMIQDEE